MKERYGMRDKVNKKFSCQASCKVLGSSLKMHVSLKKIRPLKESLSII